MMTDAAKNSVFEIAVIGGGIAGAAIADESAARDQSVILFEKNTFGSGTSCKSSKLIHGGLRYLEVAWSALRGGHLVEFWKNLRFVFLALRETRILASRWPNLIREIELLMPIYQNHGRSKLAVWFGTACYGLLARMSGARKGTRFFSSAAAVLKIEPGLNPSGLLGGVLIHDHTTDDLALVNAIIQSAQSRGAQTWERTCVEYYRWDAIRNAYEICVRQAEGMKKFYAKKLINASGPWVDQVREAATQKPSHLIVPVAGAHIEIPVFSNYSAILQAEDGRIFFVVNRGRSARIGTTERLMIHPEQVQATEDEIRYLLDGVRWFFPNLSNDKKIVLSSDAGIRPLAKPEVNVDFNQISREHKFIQDKDGVIHVLGVKLTDHRRAAAELFKQFFDRSK